MKKQKSNPIHIRIEIYIGLDHTKEEWWESLNLQGDTNRFHYGTSNFTTVKTFKTIESAIKHGEKKEFDRFRVVTQDFYKIGETNLQVVYDSSNKEK